ncbi:MAG: DNA recombination protein RmuC [Bacteroidales bacterium]|nr:DNA recombination protein RmuC [Bacteroidales bacterium]
MEDGIMEILQLTGLIAIVSILTYIIALAFNKKGKSGLMIENAVLVERNSKLQTDNQSLSDETQKLRDQLKQCDKQSEYLRVELDFQKQKIFESEKNLNQIKQQMQSEFENLANKILKDNSRQFSTSSSEQIGLLLEPMKERLGGFEKKIDDHFRAGHKHQAELFGAFKEMFDMNRQLKNEAERLVHTLRGDVKKLGSWGELILDKILEISGLKEGYEYKREVQLKDDKGKWLRPDVILYLPDNKNIIIDSKTSLVAYERYINATDKSIRLKALKEHIDSIKTHIRQLGDKSYQSIPGLRAPDYVLLFMPIESAFSAALEADHEIFEFAWERKIVIVSPSTLLATLKTIHAIWQSEKQSRNAQEIARQGGALYDKFANFIKDLEKVGKQIDLSQQSYHEAMKKLSTGRGNLITRVESLRSLGVKSTKELDKYNNETNHE